MTPGESPGSSVFYRSPSRALAVAVAGVVGMALVVLLYPGVPGPLWMQQVVELAVISAPALLAFALAAVVAGRPQLMKRLLAFRWTDVALGLSVGLVLRALSELLLPTTGSLLAGFGEIGLSSIIVLVVGAVVLTPIVEELFFRGLGVAALLDATGALGRTASAVIAISISTAVFIAVHLLSAGASAGWITALGPLVVGIGCGVLFALTRRLAASVTAHIVFNAGGVLLLLV